MYESMILELAAREGEARQRNLDSERETYRDLLWLFAATSGFAAAVRYEIGWYCDDNGYNAAGYFCDPMDPDAIY